MAKKKTEPTVSVPPSIGGLGTDPRNPRKITEAAAQGLTYSLAEFGDLSGIVWNARTGQLVAGHQRVDRIKAKWGDLPIVDGAITTPEGHRFAVRVVDWPESTQRAANIAANAPTIAGEFTDDLALMLESIKVENSDLFDAMLFDDLLGAVSVPADKDCSPQLSEAMQYKIVIDCESEQHQAELLEEFEKRKLTHKAMII